MEECKCLCVIVAVLTVIECVVYETLIDSCQVVTGCCWSHCGGCYQGRAADKISLADSILFPLSPPGSLLAAERYKTLFMVQCQAELNLSGTQPSRRFTMALESSLLSVILLKVQRCGNIKTFPSSTVIM